MPTLAEINPQIGDVVYHESSGHKSLYVMEEEGLRGVEYGEYIDDNYWTDNNSNFYLHSRHKCIVVGDTYKTNNGNMWECILKEGNKVWMRSTSWEDSAAYVWKEDGTPITLNGVYKEYFVLFPSDIKEGVEVSGTLTVGGRDENFSGTVTTENDRPKWETLEEVKGN